MAAILKHDAYAPADPASVESVEEALAELTRLFVEADARRGRLLRRMDELRMGARELRRRRARTELDAFLPPLRLISIERAEAGPAAPPTLRAALRTLYEALDDVLRIWWAKHFLAW